MRRLAFAATALVLAACGRLESPDLGTGTVRGRLVGGRAGAYVYPLGLPEAKALVAADGRFEIERVPAGDVSLVVIDGADPIDGARRAGIVLVEVEGAEENEIDEIDASALPLAGRVFALPRAAGGAVPAMPRFTVVGTDQIDVGPGPTGLAALDPLPPGSFELTAAMDGYATARVALVVTSATLLQEVPLAVDPSSEAPGCGATGGCVNGLVCVGSGGECQECVADADCAAHGPAARCLDRACTVAGTASMSGLVCAGCAEDADCASGVCAPDESGGSCSRTCSSGGDCFAGFECRQLEGRGVCVPPAGCEEYRERFGTPCLDDSACAEGLAGGTCLGADEAAVPPRPGRCTAPCDGAVADACSVVPGQACDAGAGSVGFCVPTTPT